jgi:hypothetical protein
MYCESIPDETLSVLRADFGIPPDVSVLFHWEHEDDATPEDSFCDPDSVQWVRDMMEYTGAAWFRCRVTVTDGDAEGHDYLGACSYRSFEEFLVPDTGEYLRDMVGHAFAQFQQDAGRLAAKYAPAASR